jgi:4-hydroxy-4-methyl-2-oxoglutarate aldolase
MAIQRAKAHFPKLSAEELSAWKAIPVAIAGDAMNRQNLLHSRVRPLGQNYHLLGQARTVSVIAGDNSAIHAALGLVEPGQVLMVDGGGHTDRALWGDILSSVAKRKNLAGIVLDGAVRDVAELRGGDMPVYASGVSPAGPTKGWGGTIDTAISCGGVAVKPGDVILGDDDGVAVIPLERVNALRTLAEERLAFEADVLERIAKDEDTASIFAPQTIEDI